MHSGSTIFAELIGFLPNRECRRLDRYHGNKRVRTLPCWDQLLALAFAQSTYRESLRDIVANSITWVFAARSLVPLWPTPTSLAIGTSSLILPNC